MDALCFSSIKGHFESVSQFKVYNFSAKFLLATLIKEPKSGHGRKQTYVFLKCSFACFFMYLLAFILVSCAEMVESFEKALFVGQKWMVAISLTFVVKFNDLRCIEIEVFLLLEHWNKNNSICDWKL